MLLDGPRTLTFDEALDANRIAYAQWVAFGDAVIAAQKVLEAAKAEVDAAYVTLRWTRADVVNFAEGRGPTVYPKGVWK